MRRWYAFFALVLVHGVPAVKAQSLIPGTFEQGQGAPSGWQRRGDGTWAEGAAHSGRRFLRGNSPSGGVAWESDRVAVEPATDYRVEGWLRAADSAATLVVEFLDDQGATVSRAESGTVQRVADWRYVAVEAASGPAVAARIQFRVRGAADLDDVAFTQAATSFLGNKSFDADDRGRIGFWSEEKNDLFPGSPRAGKGRPDSTVARTGKTSLELTATAGWYGWSSIPYGVPAWTGRLRLSGWARCEESSQAQLLACWFDDRQKVLRVDATQPAGGADWRQLVLLPPDPPPGAATVRAVAVARGARVWFDDFEILRLRPQTPAARIFVNQVGYEQDGPKSVIVATNTFPTTATTIAVQLIAAGGEEVARVDAPCAGRVYGGTPDDWGWYFWRADFTGFRTPGAYRAAVAVSEGAKAVSPAFKIGPGLLLAETAQPAVDFFFIQRCGCDVPGWHRACHLDDARLPDGMHIDATGGWHSAGDYNKLMYEHGDGGVAFALLAAHQADPHLFSGHDRDGDGVPDVLDEACWGADFVAKMQIPETGGLRNHLHQGPGRNWTRWTAPDVHTDNQIGTADDPVITPGEGQSPLAIGAWARLAVLPSAKVAKKGYLRRAERLWEHATKQGTQVASPHLLLSALELYRVTRREAYLDAARRAVEALLAQQNPSGRSRGAFGTYGAITAAALAQFALDQPHDDRVAKIREALKTYLAFCLSTADNPFGFARQPGPDADAFFPPNMGNNFEILSRAWAGALVHRVTGDARALRFAVDQMDWILGKNPEGLCMFEGKGERNPPRYHHRYNMIPGHERGAVPGCIPNGFVRDLGLADRPGFDFSRGGNRSPSFRTSEPWLVHNLYFLLAAAALHPRPARP